MLCTPLYPMVLLIIIPMKNGYFIGNIPNIFRQTQMDTKLPLFLGPTLSHWVVQLKSSGSGLKSIVQICKAMAGRLLAWKGTCPIGRCWEWKGTLYQVKMAVGLCPIFLGRKWLSLWPLSCWFALEIQTKEGPVGFPAHQSATPSNKTSRRGPPPETRHQPGQNKWIITWNEDFFLAFQLHNWSTVRTWLGNPPYLWPILALFDFPLALPLGTENQDFDRIQRFHSAKEVDPCLDPIWIVFANLWREIWRRPHGGVGLEHWGPNQVIDSGDFFQSDVEVFHP